MCRILIFTSAGYGSSATSLGGGTGEPLQQVPTLARTRQLGGGNALCVVQRRPSQARQSARHSSGGVCRRVSVLFLHICVFCADEYLYGTWHVCLLLNAADPPSPCPRTCGTAPVPPLAFVPAPGRGGVDALLLALQVALSIVLLFVVFPLLWLTGGRTAMRVRVMEEEWDRIYIGHNCVFFCYNNSTVFAAIMCSKHSLKLVMTYIFILVLKIHIQLPRAQ